MLNTTAANDYTIAIGAGAQTSNATNSENGGNNQIAIGNAALTKGYGGIALGSIVRNGERDGIPIVDKQTTAGENSIALGSAAQAVGRWSMALGYLSNTSESIESIAVGYSSAATANQALSVGPIYYFREISGSTVNDAGKIVYESTVTPVVSKAAAQYATALGAGSQATAYKSLAVGTGAVASGSRAIAIGGAYNSSDKSDVQTQATAQDAMAFGNGAIAQGSYSIAIGTRSVVTTGEGIAIGGKAIASGDQSIALGADVKIYGTSSIGIGGDDLRTAGSTVVTLSDANKTTTNLHDTFKALAVRDFEDITSYTEKSSGAPAAIHLGTSARAQQAGALAIGTYANSRQLMSNAIGFGAYAMVISLKLLV